MKDELFSEISYLQLLLCIVHIKKTIEKLKMVFLIQAGKESACNAGDLGSVPGLGRSPGEGKGYPLQCCGLENSVDYKSQTPLSDFQFHVTSHPQFPFRILSPQQSTTYLLSISNLPLLDVSCKENHIASGPL